MRNTIDNFLNRITMYRLVLYALIALLIVAVTYGVIGVLPYDPVLLVYGVAVILFVAVLANTIFASVFKSVTNSESIYITALILALLISPPTAFLDPAFLSLAVASSVWAAASKYIFAIRKKHVFNPVAIGVLLPALFLMQSASWWVGTFALMPFVLISGLLIARKIRRFDLVISFLITAVIAILIGHGGTSILSTLWTAITSSSLLFFAGFMLTEPLTTPPTRAGRIWYGALIGALFLPAAHIGSVYFTPELALVVGNLFSYLISPKEKLTLTLIRKERAAKDTYDFVFSADRRFRFKAGQYLEWTLGGVRTNNRGNRRYFTIASAPSEKEVRMGVKFYPDPSAYKERLLALNPGDTITAGQRAGDFTLPKNADTGLVFIAGGIGVTPFRSMIQDLVLKKKKRNITMFYSNKKAEDIAYQTIFDSAEGVGVRTVYTLTDKSSVPSNWHGETGYVTPDMIRKYVPSYQNKKFYISGPNAMVEGFSETLSDMGVPAAHIKKDFFPGFA